MTYSQHLKKIGLPVVAGVSLFIATTLSYADEAPVMSVTPSTADAANASDMNAAPVDTSSMSLDQRVAVLERQVGAMNQINLMNQLNDLQQQMQELQGQVEQLSHSLQTLQTQNTSQYSDLDQRLKKLEGPGISASTTPPAAAASTAVATPAAKPISSADEETAYESAYEKVKGGKYNEAIASLSQFLTQYPQGTYAPNAHYWLGQMYLLKGDGQSAAKEFTTVISQYPQNQKIKDANLKLGFAYLLQNKNAQAKAQFRKVMKAYPGTSTAQLAEARLAQLP